jgi:hypothetical protein
MSHMTYCRETRDKKNAVRVRVKHIFGNPVWGVYCMVLDSTFFSVQVIFCYKNSILHRQTIYRLTEKVMPFKNKCEKIQIKKFRMKYLLIFTVHAPFHPPNLFSSWNRLPKILLTLLMLWLLPTSGNIGYKICTSMIFAWLITSTSICSVLCNVGMVVSAANLQQKLAAKESSRSW